MSYKIGILGGMGPMATAKLYEMIINHTDAACDQDHIEMVILNNCSIPDRTAAILNNGDDPVDKINQGIKTLEQLKCEYFVIPCNTAHYFKNRFIMNNIKMIDMIEEALRFIKDNYVNPKVCVLCTNGTKESHVYETDTLLKIGYPSVLNQAKVMEVIYQTKAGFHKLDLLNEIIEKEKDNFDIFLFACTELSIYYDNYHQNEDILDAMDILSKKVVIKSGKKLK